jgi:hypothetical protein
MPSPFYAAAVRRALASGDPSLLQVSFDAAVLERYRGAPGFTLMRTNTVGRIKKQGGWSLDVGITSNGAAIHASWGALSMTLPDAERDHWAAHAVGGVDLCEMFLKMQLSPGSCFDDGDLRDWTA